MASNNFICMNSLILSFYQKCQIDQNFNSIRLFRLELTHSNDHFIKTKIWTEKFQTDLNKNFLSSFDDFDLHLLLLDPLLCLGRLQLVRQFGFGFLETEMKTISYWRVFLICLIKNLFLSRRNTQGWCRGWTEFSKEFFLFVN